MTPIQKEFIESVKTKAAKNNIKVSLIDSYTIKGMKCTGYFDEVELAVAVKRNFNSWFQVFIHESCHMDQFLEKSPVWNRKIKGVFQNHCPLTLYEQYVDKVIELEDNISNKVMKYCVEVEWDCEKRSVAKIKNVGLDINIHSYIRMANLYCYLYPFAFYERKWKTLSYLIRNNPDILGYVPDEFLKKPEYYLDIPKDLYKEMKKTLESKPTGA